MIHPPELLAQMRVVAKATGTESLLVGVTTVGRVAPLYQQGRR